MSELIEEFHELVDPRTNCPLMERTVLVVNTSNMPVAAREASIYTAVTLGEYFRDLGYHVLLLADSISRWAEALREVSSSLEEMPGEEGYPTYLASRLSSFVERAGIVETLSGDIGSLSMILSVSPPGGDFTEPVTQALLRTSGAFLMLDTSLANSRHFPAINWMQSYSLYQKSLAEYFKKNFSEDWHVLRDRCMEILHKEEALQEIMEIVGIEGLQKQDQLVMTIAENVRHTFLAQNAYTADAFSDPLTTLERIRKVTEPYSSAQSS
jgi:V/A-type H+-transporting ATPase subunit A